MKIKLLAWGSAIFAGLLAYLGIVLATNLANNTFLWLLVPAAMIGLVSKKSFDLIAQRRFLSELRSQWGSQGKQDKRRDFMEIRSYFDLIKHDLPFRIDDRTWEDLTGDHIFAVIDRTISIYGRQFLYKILRTPVFSEAELKNRDTVINLFQTQPELREQIQLLLHKLTQGEASSAIEFLLDQPEIPSLRHYWFYRLMFWLVILFLILLPFFPLVGLFGIIFTFLINLAIYYNVQKKISMYFHVIKAISKMIHVAKKLVNVPAPELAAEQERIKHTLKKTERYLRFSVTVALESSDPILGSLLQYLSILFLLDVRGFERSVALINQNREAFVAIYEWIGTLDANQAIASYRESLLYYCKPQFWQAKNARQEKLIGKAMYHPLVKDPIANNLTIKDEGILITGSNMSGKSTFLRTVGINALFAQTIYTCFAREYSSYFVKLLTAIGRSDNIIEGKSYYLVEAQSILRIITAINNTENEQMVMAIFDEMYRGTNSEERIKAGCNVLKYVAQAKTVILAATHDLELTTMLVPQYSNYHFREQVGTHGLEFDYVLKNGPSETRNAITLLKLLGYPEEITN